MQITSKGDFSKTTKFLEKIRRNEVFENLDRYGEMGVAALSQATPKETGESATSWKFRTVKTRNSVEIHWYNTHVNDHGTPIAVLVQYGHGTGTGGYVQGRDFINPAMRPLFDRFVNEIWEKVKAE